MTTNINADNGVSSGIPGLKTSADNSGVLALQTNGTTALTVNASQALGVGSTPSYGTSGQVLTSSGSSAAPTWTTVGGGSSQWTTSGSNIYYTTGNVSVGTTTAGARFDVDRPSNFAGGVSAVASNPQFAITNSYQYGYPTGMLFRAVLQSGGSIVNNASIWAEWSSDNNAYLGFATNGSGTLTERMRIDSSGNLLVGTTSVIQGSKVSIKGSTVQSGLGIDVDSSSAGAYSGVIVNRTASDGDVSSFLRAGTLVGKISVTTTATTYNTSSDYRLKNSIAPMSGALAKVTALKPVTYKWNVDGSDGEGFIAHELAEVVPQCVTGEKDAVDENGNPKYQGIDTSFLVATLTAAIQELKAEFDAYKASHP